MIRKGVVHPKKSVPLLGRGIVCGGYVRQDQRSRSDSGHISGLETLVSWRDELRRPYVSLFPCEVDRWGFRVDELREVE